MLDLLLLELDLYLDLEMTLDMDLDFALGLDLDGELKLDLVLNLDLDLALDFDLKLFPIQETACAIALRTSNQLCGRSLGHGPGNTH